MIRMDYPARRAADLYPNGMKYDDVSRWHEGDDTWPKSGHSWNHQ